MAATRITDSLGVFILDADEEPNRLVGRKLLSGAREFSDSLLSYKASLRAAAERPRVVLVSATSGEHFGIFPPPPAADEAVPRVLWIWLDPVPPVRLGTVQGLVGTGDKLFDRHSILILSDAEAARYGPDPVETEVGNRTSQYLGELSGLQGIGFGEKDRKFSPPSGRECPKRGSSNLRSGIARSGLCRRPSARRYH